MKITLLGTGSPEANARRASSGYLVETGRDRILFDCGGGVFDRLVRSGRRPSDITHLFFSHLHSDHMMDYARLVHAAWDEKAAPLKVFGPKPVATINDRLFGRDGAFATDLVARTEHAASKAVWVARGGTLPRPWPAPEITEVEPGFRFEGDGWTITSCAVPHAQPQLTCMALRIEADGHAFVYSGDSGLCPELEQLAQGADLLLHWCYRLSGETFGSALDALTPTPPEIGALAARCGAGRLILTHFRTHMDTDEAHASALAGLRSAFDGPVSIAEDLTEIDLA